MMIVESELPDSLPATLQHAFPVVYAELKAIAHRALSRQSSGSTLSTTGLVHEAFLKLAPRAESVSTLDRSEFFGLCACAMRHIVIDYARHRMRTPNGAAPMLMIDDVEHLVGPGDDPVSLIVIDKALRDLAELDPRLVRIIELHVFAGIELAEIADLMQLSLRSLQREWKRARAWLGEALRVV